MFDKLTEGLSRTFKKITGRGKLSEADVRRAMREVRRALLEADVHYKVAKEFVAEVTEKATGEDILSSLTPGQQVVKIVHDELVRLLGTSEAPPGLDGGPPLVFVLAGLQGSGKTTTAGRLARWLAETSGNSSLLAACDLRRPAAVDQLQKVAEQSGAGFYGRRKASDPVEVLREAVDRARESGLDVVIADTSGRLHVDEELMDELQRIVDSADPDETLLVVDGLSGQDAVNVAVEFGERVDYTGAVITKMDGDSRGGAALSFRAVTGKPVRFAGMGESMDALELFRPQSMADRILGMGDVLSLAQKAQKAFDESEAEKLQEKLRSDSLTLEDFLGEIRRIRKMGSIREIVSMLPREMRPAGADIDPDEIPRMEAIICSMTPRERRNPSIIDGSRRKRIARGSGTSVTRVNRLLKEFRAMKKLMKRMKSGIRMPFAPL
ncbi:signal recognition particle protein [Candidatus Fermentibacteria bacterium]|nr:signal recognition particle protein [Candidatus Fermentibacteria bacterium]